MRQIFIPRIGGPEVLEVRESADPQPKAGEVRIRVRFSGINFADILARMGLYPDAPKLPAVVGYEVSGEVDAVGEGVTGFAPGAKVVALTRFGGYADVVCVPTIQVSPIPEGLSFEQAAAIPVTYLTAWLMLIRLGNLQKAERVLIHGAAGGVGQAALQLARWRGAEIFGTASPSKHARLKEQGVHHCIDYRNGDFAEAVKRITSGRGVDLIIDPIGGRSFAKSYASLAPLGRLFMFGVSSFAPGEKRSIPAALKGLLGMPSFKPVGLMNENRGVFGVNLGHLWDRTAELKSMLDEILALTHDGTLSPTVDRSFRFTEAAAAHAYVQSRQSFGKVLLAP